MIHQPLGGFQGQASDIDIQRTRNPRTCASVSTKSSPSIPASRSNRSPADTDRDNFMSAAEAKSYGLVDEVIEQRPAETVKTA